jgi:uncharacterized protein YjbI with pentapeptide repeats
MYDADRLGWSFMDKNGLRTLNLWLPAMAVAAVILLPSPSSAANCRAAPAPEVDWSGCDKSRVMLDGSDLHGANLFDANLTSTDLRGANLTGAKLEKATLIRASLAGATADKASFVHIEAYRTAFAGISAEGASFAAAEMQRSDLTKAKLTGADFEKAELGRVNFAGATLGNTNFSLSNLSRAEFAGAVVSGPVNFDHAFLYLARFEGVDLSAATGLEQGQIDLACGDADTKLPAGIKPPAGWPCDFTND